MKRICCHVRVHLCVFSFPASWNHRSRCDKSENTDMGWAISRQLQLNFEWPGKCNASRASAVASYNRMPAPTQILGKEKPGIRVSRSRWEFSSPVREVKYLLLPLDYQHHARFEVGRRASPPSHDEPDALERHI